MKNDVKMVLAIFIIAVIGIIGIPKWPIDAQTIGNFRVAKNQFGIAIYQEQKYSQYQFNTFESYTVDKNVVTLSKINPLRPVIQYNRDDIIIDDQRILYTEPLMAELIFVEQKIGLPLIKDDAPERSIQVRSNKLLIINPRAPGILLIEFPKGINIFINRQEKTITTDESIKEIKITIYDDLAKPRLARD